MDKDLEIMGLVELWYRLMIGHHKDRDCHFYVELDYQYAGDLVIVASHYGYVAGEWSYKAKSLVAAQSALAEYLQLIIRQEANELLERNANKEEWGNEVTDEEAVGVRKVLDELNGREDDIADRNISYSEQNS